MEDKLEIWNLSLDDQDPMMLLIHRLFKQLQPYSLCSLYLVADRAWVIQNSFLIATIDYYGEQMGNIYLVPKVLFACIIGGLQEQIV